MVTRMNICAHRVRLEADDVTPEIGALDGLS